MSFPAKVDALVCNAGITGKTAATRQRKLNYLQRLYLILPFNASHANSFTGFMIPVETFTTPEIIFRFLYDNLF